MYTNRVSRLVARSGILIVLCLVSSISTSQVVDLAEQELLIKKACPKQWEGLYSSIELNPNVLDIWRGDLSDKAQFIQYANAEGRNGRPRLLGENGQLLIDDYNDVITIMAECGAQRVLYYKSVRERVGASISGMVSKLEDHTAFGRSGVSTGVAYDNWVELTTGEGEEVVEVPFNLAIGRNTTQSGTSSDDLSDTETERSEDEYADLAEGW